MSAITCMDGIGRAGPRHGQECGNPASWFDTVFEIPLCPSHAAAAVRSETIDREDLERLSDRLESHGALPGSSPRLPR